MIHIDNVILDKICLHKVGNKVEEEGVIFSKSPLCVNEGTYHSGRCRIIYNKWNKKYHDG